MIFETHAHYDDESFNDDREALTVPWPEKGIGQDHQCWGFDRDNKDNSGTCRKI